MAGPPKAVKRQREREAARKVRQSSSDAAAPKRNNEQPNEASKKKTLGQVLIELVRLRGPQQTVNADEVARAFRPPRADEVKGQEVWRGFTRQVRGEAIGLARKGEIEILRRGEVIDPNKPFKGLYKVRLKSDQE